LLIVGDPALKAVLFFINHQKCNFKGINFVQYKITLFLLDV